MNRFILQSCQIRLKDCNSLLKRYFNRFAVAKWDDVPSSFHSGFALRAAGSITSLHVSPLNKRFLATSIVRISTRTMASPSFKNKKGETSMLRHVKYQEERKGQLQPPGVIEVQVIGTGYPGTPRSLLVHMDHFKYLFNCGEGTQRISMEHKMRISKVQQIFITRHHWDNISGLLGMCLSLESMDVPTVTVHGPPEVEKLVTMSKGFAQLRKIRVEKQELENDCFIDSAMKIDYIIMSPLQSADLDLTKKETLAAITVAYLCQPHPKPRSVSLEKCVELGIPRGPMIGQLKNGEEVTLPNGKCVKPDDILDDPEPNNPFLVLQCPSIEYLPSLYTNKAVCGKNLGLVIHMTPQHVLMDVSYQEWLSSLPSDTTHIVLNEHCSGLAFEGVYRFQTMLNMIHDNIFPAMPMPHIPNGDTQTVSEENSPIMHLGETNLRYGVRSKKLGGITTKDQCIQIDEATFRKAAYDQEDFTVALADVQEQLKACGLPEDSISYPEILFLGTGSAIPNKVRNVSAIWLNLSNTNAVLLDCGENTFGQLLRHYGSATDDMLLNLSAVFVSHLHADHHLGIITITRERRRVLEARGKDVTPLLVIAPPQLAEWYQAIDELGLESSLSTKVLAVQHFYRNPPEEYDSQDVYHHVLEKLGMRQIEMVYVNHRQFPHGVVLIHKDGWKLVYSGDTMPCANLVKAGQCCDVLIHEATMEDDLEEEAKQKRHSTTSQAIQVGLDMDAKFILLTHFSQRYAKVPLFNENFTNRVGIAFDNMRVTLNQLKLIPHFLPALKAMFADEYAEMEERKVKRSYRKLVEEKAECKDRSKRSKNTSSPERNSNEITAE